ncbi:hypothetical protein LOK49_LG15G01680 [Camellia lanceoleosa]|uniref:Uncharacterized protein n=1 Tax=Camellia lanceoleosa TaxID=1840588 RepID=A0ACC0F600_9ERIC|nr:hypothetical protein LOK49_LG15G01680 [Camellia lanceoleosa]
MSNPKRPVGSFASMASATTTDVGTHISQQLSFLPTACKQQALSHAEENHTLLTSARLRSSPSRPPSSPTTILANEVVAVAHRSVTESTILMLNQSLRCRQGGMPVGRGAER